MSFQNNQDSILPSSVVVAPIHWDIMDEIQRAQQTDPSPPSCPPTKQYVPRILRQRVIQWVHSSLSAGHPGIQRTIALMCKIILVVRLN